MARRNPAGGRQRNRKPAGGKSRTRKVRGHSRSPRGPDKGKPTVKVKGYKRASARRR